jgi:phage terminase large subunit
VFRPVAGPKPAPWAGQSLADVWREEVALAATADSATIQPLTRYATDPVGFLVDKLGITRESLVWSANSEYATHDWDGAKDPLVQAMEAVARCEWVAISSGTGTGKTFLMAALILWHCACFRDSIAVTVATKEDQLEKGVWREVARLWPAFSKLFPQAELTHLRLRMDPPRGDAWGAWGVTSKVGASEQSATGVQGLHAPRLLILCDEMPGIPMPIITALVNTATDPGNVIAGFGNPDNETDPLAKFGRMKRVRAIRVSALDHPNVVTGRSIVPGAVSRGSIQMRADEYGVESPLYGSRVQGIAPAQAQDALIHRVWCEAAVTRAALWAQHKTLEGYPIAYGVDPSNSDGGDEAAVVRMLGPSVTMIRSKPCPDANALGLEVFLLAQAEGVVPEAVGVDSIGVGAGTVNESRRLYEGRARFTPLNGGASAVVRAQKGKDGEGWTADANVFLNLRAQMYWQLREDLRKGLVGLPDDPALIEELIMPTYEVRSGKIVVEPKADIKARLGRSPNRADAVVYANWVRPRTKAPEGLPPDAANKHLGLTRDATTGKPRVKRLDDMVKHPGRPSAVPESGRWWEHWGR